jgi:hypothetical protein
MASNKCGKEKCNKPNCKSDNCKNTTVVTATASPAAFQPASATPVMAAKAAGIQITSAKSAKPRVSAITAVETISNPSEAIRDTAASFHKLYEQYTALRILAQPLNGLPQADPFPDNVKIQNVNIAFTVDGAAHTAEISSPKLIGEIAALIGNELRSLIERMYQELFALEHVTSGMQKAVQQAISSAGANKTTSGITLQQVTAAEQLNEEETQSD